jgi:hypothetical protein
MPGYAVSTAGAVLRHEVRDDTQEMLAALRCGRVDVGAGRQ